MKEEKDMRNVRWQGHKHGHRVKGELDVRSVRDGKDKGVGHRVKGESEGRRLGHQTDTSVRTRSEGRGRGERCQE